VLPTVAKLLGVELPAERKIDGRDIWPLMTAADDNVPSPHDVYYCYYDHELRAVRDERWKLVLPHKSRTLNGRAGGRNGINVPYEQEAVELALYDLDADVGETTDVAADHPEVVSRLQTAAEAARADLGDSLTGRTGANVRLAGRARH
jgi:arylsulfatase A